MDEFTKVEYQACLDLLKYYDQRQASLLQFSALLSSAVGTAMLAIIKDSQVITVPFLQLLAIAAGATVVGLGAILAMMVQTRLYFVYPTRQVNAIRKAELARIGPVFETHMYVDTAFPAWKLRSAHAATLALVCIQIGVFAAVSAFAANGQLAFGISNFLRSGSLGALIATLSFITAANYLSKNGTVSADHAVHGITEASNDA